MARRDGVCQSITVSFLFHFNQDIGPYTRVANLACYAGLLSVLKKHKNKRFDVHISGTLIESLIHYAPETLKEIQRCVANGQFEILGSTYAQNVMAATDEISNRYQIEQHLEILQETFGVRPKGFWVPERCWKQKFVKLLSDFGYTYTLIEKQTLEKIKLQNYHLPYKTCYKDRSIVIVQDDEHFKHKVNFAVWCGEPLHPCHSRLPRFAGQGGNPKRAWNQHGDSFELALSHLEALASEKDASSSTCGERADSIVVYAEDAEASGLWGVPFGAYPQQVWENWDLLLNRLSHDKNFQVSTIGDFLKRTKIEKEIGAIPDGQAEWMAQSLRKKGAPYHEDGFKDWFDFNRRSPKIRKYRKFFAKLASEIQKAETMARRCQKSRFIGTAISGKSHPNCSRQFSVGIKNGSPPFKREVSRWMRTSPLAGEANAYIQQAKLLLCRSQYEFGCIGIGKKNYAPFDKARECLVPLKKFWKIINSEKKYKYMARVYPSAVILRQKAEESHLQIRSKPRFFTLFRMTQGHSNSEWKKFKKIVPIKKVWFKKFIANWIFDLAPPKVVQYCSFHKKPFFKI